MGRPAEVIVLATDYLEHGCGCLNDIEATRCGRCGQAL